MAHYLGSQGCLVVPQPTCYFSWIQMRGFCPFGHHLQDKVAPSFCPSPTLLLWHLFNRRFCENLRVSRQLWPLFLQRWGQSRLPPSLSGKAVKLRYLWWSISLGFEPWSFHQVNFEPTSTEDWTIFQQFIMDDVKMVVIKRRLLYKKREIALFTRAETSSIFDRFLNVHNLDDEVR